MPLFEKEKSHWVLVTNISFNCDDPINTVYVYDFFYQVSYRQKEGWLSYPISFIQDICGLMRQQKNSKLLMSKF